MNNIDLQIRSEKTRAIIGRIPNRIIMYGTIIIGLVFLLIICVSLLVKYPSYVHCTIIVKNNEALLKFKKLDDATLIHSGNIVKFMDSDQSISGVIHLDNYDTIRFDGSYYCIAGKIVLSNKRDINVVLTDSIFNASVLMSEKSLFKTVANIK